MRRTGKGVDPRAMIFDLSSDPVTSGTQRCELVRDRISKLLKEYPRRGRKSYQDLLQAYVSLANESGNALVAISRYIGGVYARSRVCRTGAGREALHAGGQGHAAESDGRAGEVRLAPDAWLAPADLLAHLQQQRRGFRFQPGGRTAEAARPHLQGAEGAAQSSYESRGAAAHP